MQKRFLEYNDGCKYSQIYRSYQSMINMATLPQWKVSVFVSLFYVLCYCSYLHKNLHGTKYDYQREKIMNVCFAWLSIHIREISYKKFC